MGNKNIHIDGNNVSILLDNNNNKKLLFIMEPIQ